MPDPSSRSATRPAVRLRPVPPLDPPFEDELAPEIWSAGSGSGQLALDLTSGVARAFGRAGAVEARGRAGAVEARGRAGAGGADFASRTGASAGAASAGAASARGPGSAPPTVAPGGSPPVVAAGGPVATGGPGAVATSAGPAAKQAARRFLVVCLEVLNGYRPLAHLRPLISPADLEAVLTQVATGVERLARARRAGKRMPAQLRVVRVCEPRPGAVEAAAVLGDAGRTWALAFRLERRQGQWVSTAVRVL